MRKQLAFVRQQIPAKQNLKVFLRHTHTNFLFLLPWKCLNLFFLALKEVVTEDCLLLLSYLSHTMLFLHLWTESILQFTKFRSRVCSFFLKYCQLIKNIISFFFCEWLDKNSIQVTFVEQLHTFLAGTLGQKGEEEFVLVLRHRVQNGRV